MTRAIEGASRKPTWWERVTTLVLIPPACFAAYWLGTLVAGPTSGPTRLPSIGGLHIDAKDLDLGEVWETPEHIAVVPVRNVGTAPVTIAEFVSSCDCSGVEPKSLTLQPGEREDLAVKLDLSHRQPYQLGLAKRPVKVRIDPLFSGDYAPTPGWEIRGTVLSRLTLETSSIAFGDQCVRGGPPVARKVRMTAHTPLERLEASASPELAVVRIEPDGEPGRYVLVVNPKPNLPVGQFNFRVLVSAAALDGASHRCSAIQVSGEMQPPIRVLPRVVLLGEHPVSSLGEADVTVRLPADGWDVIRVETDDPDLAVARSGTDPDSAIRYRVTLHFRQPGDHVATVRFVARRADGHTEAAVVDVRYHVESARQ